jgi:hypothetical protein
MALTGRLRSQILPSAPFDCSQSDRDHHEDKKGGSNITHGTHPICIGFEMTEGITPLRR